MASTNRRTSARTPTVRRCRRALDSQARLVVEEGGIGAVVSPVLLVGAIAFGGPSVKGRRRRRERAHGGTEEVRVTAIEVDHAPSIDA